MRSKIHWSSIIIFQVPDITPLYAAWCPVKNMLVDIMSVDTHMFANGHNTVDRSTILRPAISVCGAQIAVQLVNTVSPS